MDTKEQISFTTITSNPTQLWIGKYEHIMQQVQLFLQKVFCPHTACHVCTTCIQIRDKQHHAIMWICPEKTYTVEHLDGLFAAIAYSLQPDEQFFFVIQKADLLSLTCANKLLKSIEEPPAGYHFILLAEHIDQVLPTIVSRCAIQKFPEKINSHRHQPLLECLTSKPCTIVEFSKVVDAAQLNEQETIDVFNEVISYWIEQATEKDTPDNRIFYQQLVRTLHTMLSALPMPGSSSIFWRNAFLSTTAIIKRIGQ